MAPKCEQNVNGFARGKGKICFRRASVIRVVARTTARLRKLNSGSLRVELVVYSTTGVFFNCSINVVVP